MKGILDSLIERYPSLECVKNDIWNAYEFIEETYVNGGKLLVCGNGGSAADADHIVGELMKGFLLQRPLDECEKSCFNDVRDGCVISDALQGGLPAISLCAQAALMTAYMNDVGADTVFAQQVYAYSKNSPDVLVALSTSGNSDNVVKAVAAANAVGIKSIAITGQKESKLSKDSTVCIRLPETETYKIQELTLPVYHTLCAMTEKRFFSK